MAGSSDPNTTADEWVPVDGVGAPDAERHMEDLDLVPDLTHPVRGALLRRLRTPRTVADLADALDVPITRLYHHVNRLESLGMIRVVATRRVGAVTERRYQVTALSWKLSEQAFETLDHRELARALGSLFDVAKVGLQRWIEAGGHEREVKSGDRFTLSLGEARLSPERQRELVRRLNELTNEFASDAEDDAEDGADTPRTTLFLAVFPDS